MGRGASKHERAKAAAVQIYVTTQNAPGRPFISRQSASWAGAEVSECTAVVRDARCGRILNPPETTTYNIADGLLPTTEAIESRRGATEAVESRRAGAAEAVESRRTTEAVESRRKTEAVEDRLLSRGGGRAKVAHAHAHPIASMTAIGASRVASTTVPSVESSIPAACCNESAWSSN